MERKKSSLIYASLAVMFWATIPTAFKLSLGQLDILPMLTVASFTSAVVLFIIVALQKKTGQIRIKTPGELMSSALLGLINPFLYYLILLNAYKLLPAQVAQPLNMIWPLILVFLSIPVLKQKIGYRSFVALLISFAGVYVISSQGHLFHAGNTNLAGVLMATGSSFFWAAYFIFNVRDKRDESVKLLLNFIFGSLYLSIAMTVSGGWMDFTGWEGIAGSVYVGVFEMGITFFFWLKALQTAPTTADVSNLVYVAPFLSLIFVHYILGEPVYITTPVGLVLIVSGIFYQNWRSKIVV